MLHGNSDPAYTPKQKKGETDDSDGRKMKHNKECELIHIFEILCHTYHMKNRFAKADKYNSQLIKKKKSVCLELEQCFQNFFVWIHLLRVTHFCNPNHNKPYQSIQRRVNSCINEHSMESFQVLSLYLRF